MFGDLVLTHDMMVEGVHWLPDADPADVAWKLVGVNLSDLAAKGAKPLGVLLGYMVGDSDWDARFVAALGDALSHYDTALWGGDTVAAPHRNGGSARAIGLTAIGRASHTPVPSRSGAQPGDALWVTGTIGDAMLGFLGDTGVRDCDAATTMRFRRPVPRRAEGIALAPHVTAIMDISDGLLLDSQRLAVASGVTIAIDSAAIPMSAALRDALTSDPMLGPRALSWGDDYELLFTLPPGVVPAVDATRIGQVHSAADCPLLIDAAPPPAQLQLGWEHGRQTD